MGVTGITTAASLLMVAVIGIAAGLHYYVLSMTATVLTLLVLAGLKLAEQRMGKGGREDASGPPGEGPGGTA